MRTCVATEHRVRVNVVGIVGGARDVVCGDENFVEIGLGADDRVQIIKSIEGSGVAIVEISINCVHDDSDRVGRLLVEVHTDLFVNVVGDVVGWVISNHFCKEKAGGNMRAGNFLYGAVLGG